MADADLRQSQVGVIIERFILSDEVVVDETWLAKVVVLSPVGVERPSLRRLRVEEVGNEFLEGDIVATLKGLVGRLHPVVLDYSTSEDALEHVVVPGRELIVISRKDSLEWFANEYEFIVGI